MENLEMKIAKLKLQIKKANPLSKRYDDLCDQLLKLRTQKRKEFAIDHVDKFHKGLIKF